MNPNCLIISEDIVFTSIIQRFILNTYKHPSINKCTSFGFLKRIEENENYDVILLDNSITGAANYEVITFLRLNRNITTPVIYFSNMEIDLDKARQKGANAFFKKPFKPSEVIDKIEIILNK